MLAWLLLRGRTGRAFRALRDSETAAVSSGVSLARYKTLAFGVSAAYAGAAGALFAIATTYVNPDTFPISLSIFLLVGVVVAGLGSLTGLIAGAIFIQFLPLWAQNVSKSPGAPAVVYGVVPDPRHVLLPGGVSGLIARLGLTRRGQLSEFLTSRGYHRSMTSRLARRHMSTKGLQAMTRKLALTCLALGAALALFVTAALAGTTAGAADPGVTPTSILLGGTSPLSGPASAYASVARGADAYFKYVDAKGGVLGRTITYKYVDDAYNPAQSVQVTRQLVEQDKVFAVYNSLGTEQTSQCATTSTPRKCRSCSSPPALRPGAATSPSTRTRAVSSPATRLRDGSTASIWRERPRARRSPSSSRTTTTERISSPGSSAASSGRR